MTDTPQDPDVQHAGWKERRNRAVQAPTGNLALVETRWFPAGTVADAAAVAVEAERAGASETVNVSELQRVSLATGEPEYGLRVWDANSPAIRAFEQIDTFAYDPAWVIDAMFTPVSADRTIPFEHIRDAGSTRDLVVPGDITFELDGTRFNLAAFDDDGTLLLVFGDPTNGRDDDTGTYGSGRFLFVGASHSNNSRDSTPVKLDFNRAFVPPCGFSAQYNCPMPPPQNRLPWPVLAGERNVRFMPGFDIYDAQ